MQLIAVLNTSNTSVCVLNRKSRVTRKLRVAFDLVSATEAGQRRQKRRLTGSQDGTSQSQGAEETQRLMRVDLVKAAKPTQDQLYPISLKWVGKIARDRVIARSRDGIGSRGINRCHTYRSRYVRTCKLSMDHKFESPDVCSK